MRAHRPDESGETLVEVIIALLILGAVVASFFASIATTATASKAHRDLVTADAVLRDYAETTKQAVRDGCGVASPTTFTVSYTPPAGYGVSSSPSLSNQPCPAVTTVALEQLTVTLPDGTTKELDIEVRTP